MSSHADIDGWDDYDGDEDDYDNLDDLDEDDDDNLDNLDDLAEDDDDNLDDLDEDNDQHPPDQDCFESSTVAPVARKPVGPPFHLLFSLRPLFLVLGFFISTTTSPSLRPKSLKASLSPMKS